MNEQLVRGIIEAATNDDNGYNAKFLKVAELLKAFENKAKLNGATLVLSKA